MSDREKGVHTGGFPGKEKNPGKQRTSVNRCQMDWKFSLDCAYYGGGTEWFP